ncbi:PREDICTED: cytidine deaminase-like isoform X1 [Acromyrmex echinatior]|uniref:cytidine deaminase-like isoform X1 n=1 Tax=Acromyrmex echinatior TaxID=103372 RepID=UPI000580E300|nr:PREDICTED: cytidine deaminase-like isoform X1 [Acromyrmex echinatior]
MYERYKFIFDLHLPRVVHSIRQRCRYYIDGEIQELIKESAAVRENAYSPYSKFKVGAAVRCVDGSISQGCNVENASYPAGVCAEVTAIARAVSEGKRKFTALAVVADQENTSFTTPCGVCRQFMSEFGENMPIYLTRSDMKKVLRTKVNELLPLSPFRTNDTETS